MLEEALKEVLERRFGYDRFEDVAKGKRGAEPVIDYLNRNRFGMVIRWGKPHPTCFAFLRSR